MLWPRSSEIFRSSSQAAACPYPPYLPNRVTYFSYFETLRNILSVNNQFVSSEITWRFSGIIFGCAQQVENQDFAKWGPSCLSNCVNNSSYPRALRWYKEFSQNSFKLLQSTNLRVETKRKFFGIQLGSVKKYKTNVQPPLRWNKTPLMIPIMSEAVCGVLNFCFVSCAVF